MLKLRKNIRQELVFKRSNMYTEISWHIEFPTSYRHFAQSTLDRILGENSNKIWFICTLDDMTIMCLEMSESEITILKLSIPQFTAKVIPKT